MPEGRWVSDDKTAARITGRKLLPWSTKLNPIWWLKNDEDRTAIDVPWFLPDKPLWYRNIMWWVRNPCANFVEYVIGVRDRNYTIVGSSPVNGATKADAGERGWKWSIIRLGYLRLPLISYAGERWLWYVGWRFNGGFGLKINRKSAA